MKHSFAVRPFFVPFLVASILACSSSNTPAPVADSAVDDTEAPDTNMPETVADTEMPDTAMETAPMCVAHATTCIRGATGDKACCAGDVCTRTMSAFARCCLPLGTACTADDDCCGGTIAGMGSSPLGCPASKCCIKAGINPIALGGTATDCCSGKLMGTNCAP